MFNKAIAIIAGSLFVAVAVNFFIIPNHLLDGGIVGIALIAKYAYGVKTGITIILLSLPLYIIAFFFNRDYFYNGIHGLLVSSLLIDVLHPISQWNPDGGPIWFGAIIAGVLVGAGIGIMLYNDISTGGTDLMALILSSITSVNAGIFIFLIDCIVLWIGWVAIPEVTFFYSAVMVLTVGFVTSSTIKLLSRILQKSS